jgi:hypothetical protein
MAELGARRAWETRRRRLSELETVRALGHRQGLAVLDTRKSARRKKKRREMGMGKADEQRREGWTWHERGANTRELSAQERQARRARCAEEGEEGDGRAVCQGRRWARGVPGKKTRREQGDTRATEIRTRRGRQDFYCRRKRRL